MMKSNPYNLYKNADLDTSSNYELVGKLYARAALTLKRACGYIDDKRLDLACADIIKAQIIVTTLNESLDLQYGIAHQLRPLYVYMLKRMREANIKKDKDILNEISGMLFELRDTWDEAVKRFKMTPTA